MRASSRRGLRHLLRRYRPLARAQYVGLTTRDVTNSLVVNLAGSGQVAPTYWLNRDNGVSYGIVLQTPQYKLDSLSSLSNLPIMAPAATSLQVLGGFADIKRDVANAVVSQYDLQGLIQVYAGVQGRDLGAVATDILRIVDEVMQTNPKVLLGQAAGQVRTMEDAFFGAAVRTPRRNRADLPLDRGVKIPSWSDPFVIITALPAALAGIVWMLFLTHTTLSVRLHSPAPSCACWRFDGVELGAGVSASRASGSRSWATQPRPPSMQASCASAPSP